MPFPFLRDDPRQRRRLARPAIAAVAVVTSLLLYTYVLLSPPSSRLRADRFSSVRPGMTRQAVEGLLGGPPGDYGKYADGAIESGDGSVLQVFSVPTDGPARAESWEDDRNRFFVFFDDKGVAAAASKANYVRRSPRGGLMAKLKGALRSVLY